MHKHVHECFFLHMRMVECMDVAYIYMIPGVCIFCTSECATTFLTEKIYGSNKILYYSTYIA